eukprot:GHVP01058005.1.p1 GENE.GHVP01058005.1~~GHVP01058005.1.p1  ORF type:complete len:729 (+),score=136.69 GHVP01058005.1:2552-4738(+)
MSVRLRDFIKHIRQAKTAAGERKVVLEESNAIRNAFREQDSNYRLRNVAKLLYIQMMGYPVKFGNMEPMNLIASSKFSDKRIGYLALSQFLEEDTDILTLAINSIKRDLTHTNQYIVAMALSAVGGIGNELISRSSVKELQTLLTSASPYIKKKALICAARMVSKAPEEIEEHYNHFVPALLKEKLHGVLLACCAYIQTLVAVNPATFTQAFKSTVPILLGILKNLLTGPHSQSAEWHIQGVADPFLQIEIFQTLRCLPKETAKYEEELSDIFSILAASADSTKNISNAVVLEGCKTIFSLPKTKSLHSQGVNFLGKFLESNDTNVKGVALQVLRSVVVHDVKSINRHWDLLIEALLDADYAVKKPALETISCIINKNNVAQGVNQMTKALVVSEFEAKYDIAMKAFGAIEAHSPSPEWQMTNLIRLMSYCTFSGNFDVIRNSFVVFVQRHPELQKEATEKLFFWLKEGKCSEILLQTALWVLGEFADLLFPDSGDSTLKNRSETSNITVEDIFQTLNSIGSRFSHKSISMASISESDSSPFVSPTVGSVYNNFTGSPNKYIHSSVILEYLLNCYAKLTIRLSSGNLSKLQKALRSFSDHTVVEIQQRSCEFSAISGSNFESLRLDVFDRMPISETLASKMTRNLECTAPNAESEKLGVADLLSFDDEEAFELQRTLPHNNEKDIILHPKDTNSGLLDLGFEPVKVSTLDEVFIEDPKVIKQNKVILD